MFANLVYKVQISRWIYEISAELTGRLKATIEARSAELVGFRHPSARALIQTATY